MYKIIKKHFWGYLLEIIIAIILYNFSSKAFLIYVFISIIIKIDSHTNYLRALIRIYQISNELKLLAIIKKLNIKEEEFKRISDEANLKMTDEERKSLDEDFKNIE